MKYSKKVSDMISAVTAFKGETSMKAIVKYMNNPFQMCKTEHKIEKDSKFYEAEEVKPFRSKSADTFKPIYARDVKLLPSVLDTPRAGGIDSIHAFLFVVDSFDIPAGIYLIEKEGVSKYSDIPLGAMEKIMQYDLMPEGTPFTNLLVICSEIGLKTDKYEELGYDFCMIEAGAIMQNVYRLQHKQREIYTDKNPFNVKAYGAIDKTEILNALDLNPKNFLICTTILMG